MNTFTGTGAGLSGFKPLTGQPSPTVHPSFNDAQVQQSYRFAARQQATPPAALMGYVPTNYPAFNGQHPLNKANNPFTIHGTGYPSSWSKSGRSYTFGVEQNRNPFAGGMGSGKQQHGSKQ